MNFQICYNNIFTYNILKGCVSKFAPNSTARNCFLSEKIGLFFFIFFYLFFNILITISIPIMRILNPIVLPPSRPKVSHIALSE